MQDGASRFIVVELIEDYDLSHPEFDTKEEAEAYIEASEWKCYLIHGWFLSDDT